MMQQTSDQTVPKGAWLMAFLLFLYMLINFADKIIVGLAGRPITNDLGLTESQFGFLGSAFFFLFSISAVAVGFLANKYPTRWILVALAVVWAVAQFPMVGEVGFTTLVICRIILGAGEGPAYAVAVHAIYKWFPDEKRTLPTAVLSQGSAFGVILAVPALDWIIRNYSWHAAFGALGCVGLLWCVAWVMLGREGPLSDAPAAGTANEPDVPYGQLLTSPTFLGCVLASFGAYWALSLGLTWFTKFAIELGYDQRTAALLTVTPWVFGAVLVMLAGWLSQVMVARGATTRTARGILGAAPLIVGGLVLLLLPLVEAPVMRIALVVLGTGLSGAIYVVCPAMIGEFTPTAQRGATMAIYGALYTLSGVIAPFTMGKMIDAYPTAQKLAGYLAGFNILAVILIASGLAGLLLLWPNRDKARFLPAARRGALA
jgi:MFS family permease